LYRHCRRKLISLTFSLNVIPDFTFRKVVLRGQWDEEHTMIVGPRVREGVHGAHVVTPLIRDGTTILVDRGFISQEAAESKSYQRELGEVQVLGLLRTGAKRNMFTPTNVPSEGKWYWNDPEGMAEYAGGDAANVQPVFVEQVFGKHSSSLD
jgi:surfeit locus 1 family protein